jgi:hypothetical protein
MIFRLCDSHSCLQLAHVVRQHIVPEHNLVASCLVIKGCMIENGFRNERNAYRSLVGETNVHVNGLLFICGLDVFDGFPLDTGELCSLEWHSGQVPQVVFSELHPARGRNLEFGRYSDQLPHNFKQILGFEWVMSSKWGCSLPAYADIGLPGRVCDAFLS